jgi:CMP-N-acetylneuraminic acid synthetase
MTVAALIPARGGSKRLPRKNILPLAGRPMIAYPIGAARASGVFDRVFVSTEDPEIAAVAGAEGAEVIARPAAIAEDQATVVQVCLHALETHPEVRLLCCLYATAALLRPESIRRARALLDDNPPADFVMGVSEYNYPPVQAMKRDESGFLSLMWPEWKSVQSQSYPPLVVSNGTLYWARADALRRDASFYGARLRAYLVPQDEVSDINTAADFERAAKSMEARCASPSAPMHR